MIDGTYEEVDDEDDDENEVLVKCHHCQSTRKCHVCNGTGVITSEQDSLAYDRADDDVKEASIQRHFDD